MGRNHEQIYFRCLAIFVDLVLVFVRYSLIDNLHCMNDTKTKILNSDAKQSTPKKQGGVHCPVGSRIKQFGSGRLLPNWFARVRFDWHP